MRTQIVSSKEIEVNPTHSLSPADYIDETGVTLYTAPANWSSIIECNNPECEGCQNISRMTRKHVFKSSEELISFADDVRKMKGVAIISKSTYKYIKTRVVL